MATTHRHAERLARFHRRSFSRSTKGLLLLAALGLVALVAVVPQGETPSELRGQRVWEEDGSGYTWVRDLDPRFELGVTLGILSGYLLLASILVGHKRPLGHLLPGRWRVRTHVTIGVLLLALALLHGATLALIGAFATWPSGLASLAVLVYHGASGAWKTRLVRRWGAKRWRFQHLLTAYLGLTLGLLHSLAI